MSKRRHKGASSAGAGFSMRFVSQLSSDDSTGGPGDDSIPSSNSDCGKSSALTRIEPPSRPSQAPPEPSQPPPKPSRPPSRPAATYGQPSSSQSLVGSARLGSAPMPFSTTSDAHQTQEHQPDVVRSAEDIDDFLVPEDGEGADHFSSPPPSYKASDSPLKTAQSESSGKFSFYSNQKSEQANTFHDLSRRQSQCIVEQTIESRWKKKRRSFASGAAGPRDVPFGAGVSFFHLSLAATVLLLLLEMNTSSFLFGSLLGAFLMFHVGLLLIYNIVKEVPRQNDYIIDFEELHSYMVEHQPVTTGDGISLMQPKTILKECFAMTEEYSGPTTFRPASTSKIRLRLCGSQLRMSRIAVPLEVEVPLGEINELIPDSCSDDSSSDDDAVVVGGELKHRRSRANSPQVKFLSSRSYSLLGSKVSLVPEGLNQRQRWSKKLPLRLTLDGEAQFSSQEDIPGLLSPRPADSAAKLSGRDFFLFAPTGRAKQDWFMRLKLASDPSLVSKGLASIPADHSDYVKYMDFLLIHLHPSRAARHNFLRNDALITSRQLRNLDQDLATQARPLSSASSVTSLSSASSSLDRHEVAAGATASLQSSTHGAYKQGHHSSLKSQSSTNLGGGLPPDPRHSLHSGSLLWFNAALGRLLYDAWREPRWAEKLRVRWQRKLSRLKTPSYIRQLNMTELHLGNSIPVVKKFSQPHIDSRGLWIDVGIFYKGTFHVTIDTAVNFSPLLEEQVSSTSSNHSLSSSSSGGAAAGASARMASMDDDLAPSVSLADVCSFSTDLGDDDDLSTDSDMDSGADEDDADVNEPSASATALATATSMLQSLEKSFPTMAGTISQYTGLSTSSESTAQQPPQLQQSSAPSSPPTSRLKRFAGFMAHSRIGQSVMKSNVVKKISEKVSNMPLVLCVELRQLSGTLTINFPPPPSGVVWFAFASAPHITLVAKPRVGQHEVKMNQVTDWIERKLISEFKKRLVMPNMEDLPIPLLSSGMEDDVEGDVASAIAGAGVGVGGAAGTAPGVPGGDGGGNAGDKPTAQAGHTS